MKKSLIILIIFLAGCSANLDGVGSVKAVDFDSVLYNINIEYEKLYPKKNETFVKFEKKINDMDVKRIDYITSKGETGYQLIMTSDSVIKSIGYGVEAKGRTWEISTITTIKK